MTRTGNSTRHSVVGSLSRNECITGLRSAMTVTCTATPPYRTRTLTCHHCLDVWTASLYIYYVPTLCGNGTTCEKSLVYRQGSQAKSPLPYGIGVVSYIPDDTTSSGDLRFDHGPLTRRLAPVRSIRPRHRIVLVSRSFVVLSYQYLLLYLYILSIPTMVPALGVSRST